MAIKSLTEFANLHPYIAAVFVWVIVFSVVWQVRWWLPVISPHGGWRCYFGFHDVRSKDRWEPSIYALIVTEYEHRAWCSRCGKTIGHTLLRWDGKEMVEVKP